MKVFNWISPALIVVLLANCGAAASPQETAAARGRQFLADLIDDEMGMLPEFPGSKVYWLSHDNYLAAKMLSKSHPKTAETILKAIEREGFSQSDGKTELLFGESKQVLPFRHFNLMEVRRTEDKIVRNEVATDRIMTGWEKYADLLFIASIAETDPAKAKSHWEAGMQMWDGNGFVDAVSAKHKIYATYKLALGAIAARRLSKPESVPAALGERLLAVQADSGGWITDYNADGKKIGFANVETTCLAILAIEALAAESPPTK